LVAQQLGLFLVLGLAAASPGLVPDSMDAQPELSTSKDLPMSKDMPTDADATQQQVEASISQVEADVRKMSTFEEDVRRNLLEQDKVKQGITHALGYFRRQEELAQDERDQTHVKVQRLEDEVASLQHRIKSLEADKATLTKDKAVLAEANKKVLAQVNSIFAYGQAVQTGLAFKGLAIEQNATPMMNS